MVFGIVVFTCLAGIVNNYIKMKQSSNDYQGDSDVDSRIEDLQERIEVLERVITDDRSDLKRQIDNLRED